jgi:hypothetical protein
MANDTLPPVEVHITPCEPTEAWVQMWRKLLTKDRDATYEVAVVLREPRGVRVDPLHDCSDCEAVR